ncbi:TetR/AcrR family transcriptional regulator [Paenibacillus sp. NPDC056579]|uniref:TetR/AcrR family transcriptional regulator n=1 Tax=Paenibacillus sp. NPDC056579 TaxID=3345871 RepID=UPI0036CCAE70
MFVLVCASWYKNTSTEMIAEVAGTPKALIFHHFRNKTKLYLKLEYCSRKIGAELKLDTVLAYDDFFQAIDEFSRLKFNYIRNSPDEYKLVYEALYLTPDELKPDLQEKVRGCNRGEP